tara:strand:- start:303 stop:506 length:204 start_codon:yes stop_codon:yes gene_type:complete
MSEIEKIEKIAQGIMAGYYGKKQKCGTEYQKWTHAILQADKIYKGELIVNKKTNDLGWIYVQKILQS